MYRYEIQTKAAGKWTAIGVIEVAGKDEARKAWDYVRGTLTEPARLVTHDYKGRVQVIATQGKRDGFRVTYGETLPVWSRVFPTRAAAEQFADKCRHVGDVVFGIAAA